jgi:small subunit ribosomal protein S2
LSSKASGTFDLLTKKEAARRKELTKLRRHLDGIKTMGGLPDVAIIIDQKREMTAIENVKIRNSNCFYIRYKL